jgi:hypothetical protein
MDTGRRLIYEYGVIKKRRMWLERLIGECEEEIEKLRGLGYIIKLETRYKYFDLKVLYEIDGTGGGRIRIKNKSREGTLLYKRREGGDTILLINPTNIKALLNCIIEDCEEERNAEVGV